MSATILVLEDDQALQNLLCEVLQDEGYQVVAADTLPALLSVAPQQADLLITDLLIDFQPVGLKAIQDVRRVTRAGLPALICTAAQKQTDGLQPEIAQLQAHLLHKPFTIDDLVNSVSRALERGDTEPTAVAPVPDRTTPQHGLPHILLQTTFA